MGTFILGIESSCDETSAAVLEDTVERSHVTATQEVHRNFGGVVPELASRAHQQHIVPVIETAIRQAKIEKNQLSAVAFTRGPGLLGSLLVGSSFAKGLALALDIPLIGVDHMEAHILAHFIRKPGQEQKTPSFPFLCLTVSGGHTQLVLVSDHFHMEILGATIDDAAGETFDKAAKILGLPYPGGPEIDRLARAGNSSRFSFARPVVPGLDFSFSGLKTSILYFIRDELKQDPGFIEKNKADLCASIQATVVEILMEKLRAATRYPALSGLGINETRCPASGIRDIAIAGGVSANSALRKALLEARDKEGWNVFIPPVEYTTDNAAMIAVTGYFSFLRGEISGQTVAPYARAKDTRQAIGQVEPRKQNEEEV